MFYVFLYPDISSPQSVVWLSMHVSIILLQSGTVVQSGNWLSMHISIILVQSGTVVQSGNWLSMHISIILVQSGTVVQSGILIYSKKLNCKFTLFYCKVRLYLMWNEFNCNNFPDFRVFLLHLSVYQITKC